MFPLQPPPVPFILFLLPILFFAIVKIFWRKGGAVILLVYLGVYIVLSAQGKYVHANHGGSDWDDGWCPKYFVQEYMIIRPHTSLTCLGSFFWPCIGIDHAIWHRTR